MTKYRKIFLLIKSKYNSINGNLPSSEIPFLDTGLILALSSSSQFPFPPSHAKRSISRRYESIKSIKVFPARGSISIVGDTTGLLLTKRNHLIAAHKISPNTRNTRPAKVSPICMQIRTHEPLLFIV